MAIQGQGSGWRLWKPSSVAVRTSHAGDSIVCNRSDHNVVDRIRNHMSNLTIQRSYNLLYILSKYYKYVFFSGFIMVYQRFINIYQRQTSQ